MGGVMWRHDGQKTLLNLLAEALKTSPDKVFLDFAGDKFTYANVEEESNRLAHGLRELGVNKGDRVIAILDNTINFVLTWFAVNKLGAIFVPMNTQLKGEFLRHQVHDAAGAIIVAENHYCDNIFAIEHALSEVHSLVTPKRQEPGSTSLRLHTIGSLKLEDSSPLGVEVTPRDISLIIYTSGTTGPSKGCVLPHNSVANGGKTNAWMALQGPDDILWTPAPLFHIAAGVAGLIGTLSAAGTMSIYPRFTPNGFWEEIERSKATHIQMLSVMLTIIPQMPETEAEKRCRGQVKVLFGTPLPEALVETWRSRYGIKLVASPAYGSSECFPITCIPVDRPGPDGSSGKCAPDVDVRIFDDNGDECPTGVAGEVWVRPLKPDVMFKGYWGRAEATLEALDQMWFHTGDIGKFDEDGYFYFIDRSKDCLRYGGENISSFELENVFMEHEAIAEVVVHAVKAASAEDEVKATIVLKEGAKITEEEICRWSIDRVPAFAVPRYIEFREFIERTGSGRAQKFKLREQGVTPNTWDRKLSGIQIKRIRPNVKQNAD
ncbi:MULTISPECIES: AMP-binding protein [unclassified Pannonibacter]|uniref:AMP-binding protein n=1 Tax=unclassified Pannonibacter TaxID=2627228 RepID=UPI001647E2EF|nr:MULTISPECIES: AMP-binding protein [unclassified Pannonibacter]